LSVSFGVIFDKQRTEDIYATTQRYFSKRIPQGPSSASQGNNKVVEPQVTVNVFYHTYAGPTEAHQNLSRLIVDKQVRYLGKAAQAKSDYLWILRYTSVGNATVLDPEWVKGLCKKYGNNTLDCRHLGHLADGHEEYTLQKMHEHCGSVPDPKMRTPDNQTHHLIVYIHSKGSFLRANMDFLQNANEKWMPSLTRAPMTSACLDSLLPRKGSINANGHTADSICNVCGLQVYPLWAIFVPGNMYAAHCSYISKLLPIQDYTEQMQQLARQVRPKGRRLPRERDISEFWSHVGYTNRDDHYAVGRYSNEHWIGSHPEIRACDITPSNHTGLFSQLAPQDAEKVIALADSLVQPAPRVPLFEGKWYRFRRNLLKGEVAWAQEHNHSRPHSYFLLPGILYRMHYFYGNHQSNGTGCCFPPPPDSWIWDYYPNGQVWRERINHVTAISDVAAPNYSVIW